MSPGVMTSLTLTPWAASVGCGFFTGIVPVTAQPLSVPSSFVIVAVYSTS